MKFTHENIILIESWLDQNSITPSLDSEFIIRTYKEVLMNNYKIKDKESVKLRNRGFQLQFEFVRRDLLKIIYKNNNKSASGIKSGFVYAIANPAWGDYVKIGSAIDVYDRLASYQTSSPLRDFYLIDYYFAHNRLEEESVIHNLFYRNSEWCKASVPEMKLLFKQRKINSQIKVPDEMLYEIKDRLGKPRHHVKKHRPRFT